MREDPRRVRLGASKAVKIVPQSAQSCCRITSSIRGARDVTAAPCHVCLQRLRVDRFHVRADIQIQTARFARVQTKCRTKYNSKKGYFVFGICILLDLQHLGNSRWYDNRPLKNSVLAAQVVLSNDNDAVFGMPFSSVILESYYHKSIPQVNTTGQHHMSMSCHTTSDARKSVQESRFNAMQCKSVQFDAS